MIILQSFDTWHVACKIILLQITSGQKNGKMPLISIIFDIITIQSLFYYIPQMSDNFIFLIWCIIVLHY